MTVEAAYIVPLILCVTIIILYMIMAGHDRGIVYLELKKSSERLCGGNLADVKEVDINTDILQKKMLMYKINYIDVECSKNKVVIEGKMTSKIGPEKFRDQIISFTQKKVNECKMVRKIVFLK